MKTTYKLTSIRREGYFLLSFENEQLTGFEIRFKDPLTVDAFHYFMARLPLYEGGLHWFEEIGLKVEKVAAPNEKIAMFCRLYEQHVGVKYKVSGADAGKIIHYDVNEALMHHYFRSENFLFKGKYSISNLVKYYNELRAEMAQGGKQKHPDEWDAEYCRKLRPDQLSDYYAHLRGQGLKAVKDATGRVIGWK